MGDLVDWYNAAEKEGKLSPVELAALFHYRYIRIHPFEDGNGRIARLMVNYILTRHDYPMIVVRSRRKSEYLEALHQTDLEVGPVPSDGAHAGIKEIRPFLKYFNALVATEVYNDVLFRSLTVVHMGYHQFGDSATEGSGRRAKSKELGLGLGCRLPDPGRRTKRRISV